MSYCFLIVTFKTRAPPTGAGRSTFSYPILNCKPFTKLYILLTCQQIGVNTFYKCIEFQVNSFDSYWEILIILKKYPRFLCTMSKQGQITLDIQIAGASALLQKLVPLLIVNKYSKFQMDIFDSFWEMDSDKKLYRHRRWRDDNSSTFFLWKVELKKKKCTQLLTELCLFQKHQFYIISCCSAYFPMNARTGGKW